MLLLFIDDILETQILGDLKKELDGNISGFAVEPVWELLESWLVSFENIFNEEDVGLVLE